MLQKNVHAWILICISCPAFIPRNSTACVWLDIWFHRGKNNNDDIEVFKTHVIFYTLHCRVESRTSSSRVVNWPEAHPKKKVPRALLARVVLRILYINWKAVCFVVCYSLVTCPTKRASAVRNLTAPSSKCIHHPQYNGAQSRILIISLLLSPETCLHFCIFPAQSDTSSFTKCLSDYILHCLIALSISSSSPLSNRHFRFREYHPLAVLLNKDSWTQGSNSNRKRVVQNWMHTFDSHSFLTSPGWCSDQKC